MEMKKHFFFFGAFTIKDCSEIRFWEVKCLHITLGKKVPTHNNLQEH
jgi:hypothetical protein